MGKKMSKQMCRGQLKRGKGIGKNFNRTGKRLENVSFWVKNRFFLALLETFLVIMLFGRTNVRQIYSSARGSRLFLTMLFLESFLVLKKTNSSKLYRASGIIRVGYIKLCIAR